METKVFVLKNKKVYRRLVKIYIPKSNGEGVVAKLLMFTTQHLLPAKDRTKNSRNFHAEYSTFDQDEIDSLMSSDGYGVVWTLKNDLEGKLKQPKRKIMSNEDMRKAGMKVLFEDAGLIFDNSKPIDVLKAEYAGYMSGMAGGTFMKKSSSENHGMQIPVNKVNVSESIEDAKNKARATYFDKYGEPVPEIVFNDIAFLDGLSNPSFDAKAYIASLESPPQGESLDGLSLPDLWEKYGAKFGKLPPNVHKNNPSWLKEKLAE